MMITHAPRISEEEEEEEKDGKEVSQLERRGRRIQKRNAGGFVTGHGRSPSAARSGNGRDKTQTRCLLSHMFDSQAR